MSEKIEFKLETEEGILNALRYIKESGIELRWKVIDLRATHIIDLDTITSKDWDLPRAVIIALNEPTYKMRERLKKILKTIKIHNEYKEALLENKEIIYFKEILDKEY